MCVTSDAKLAEALRKLRDHGSHIRYQHEILGVNARLDEIQAAVLRVKLPYLEQWNAARQAHAKFYTEQLRGFVETVPLAQSWATHVYYAYVVQFQNAMHSVRTGARGNRYRHSLSNSNSLATCLLEVRLHTQHAAED